jgi:hypothetical protein
MAKTKHIGKLESLLDPANTYHSDDDSVGTFACCGKDSYGEHSDSCDFEKIKKLAVEVREEHSLENPL